MHAMTHALTTRELDVNDRLLSYTDQSSPKCDKMTLLLVGIASLVFLVTSQCLLHVQQMCVSVIPMPRDGSTVNILRQMKAK